MDKLWQIFPGKWSKGRREGAAEGGWAERLQNWDPFWLKSGVGGSKGSCARFSTAAFFLVTEASAGSHFRLGVVEGGGGGSNVTSPSTERLAGLH